MSLEPERAITGSKVRQMFARMLRASRFDGRTFLELRDDEKATGQAVAVVSIASLSYGIGNSLLVAFQNGDFRLANLALAVLTTMIIGIFSALVWSFTTFLVGTKLFKGVTTFWGLVRPMFFSTTPGILFILVAVPEQLVYQISSAITGFWIIVGGVFAMKHAMGFSTFRSLLTFLVGFWVLFVIFTLFAPQP